MVPSIEAAEYVDSQTTEDIPASTRVIAVVLTEEEWRAFRAIEPEPLAWIQQQIRTRVERAASAAYEDDEC
ncbi:MAG TPA: hypothetical protein VHI98_24425 [Vicinamibacterales bacterium]|jgi:hypothetical protein|nr:hypothetical protein [Vicinamibacterales bacterium]